MTYITFFKYLAPFVIVALWATYIQTLGHVWLFVSILVSGVIGLKLVIPHAWLLLALTFLWWGLFANYKIYAVAAYIDLVFATLFSRNSN